MGGAAAWPLAARAQQTQQTRRVGVLVGLSPNEDAPTAQAFIKPFRDSMKSAGWIEGANIQIDYRFGGTLADLSKTRASATELVALKPDVIYSQGLPATLAVRQLTATIPIVFTQLIDPVGFGLARRTDAPDRAGQRQELVAVEEGCVKVKVRHRIQLYLALNYRFPGIIALNASSPAGVMQ